jgi:hypothetical protein
VLRRSAVSLIAVLAVLAVPASAGAKTNVSVGIGDQNVKMFSDPLWQALHLKKTRYFAEWNTVDQPTELAKVITFVQAAKARHVKVLLHISVDDINVHKKLPSVSQYRKKVKALIAILKPLGVKDWGVWNEANHKSQPTDKNPKRAAKFFLTMRSICTGCTIVALDVLDQKGVETYINKWFKALGKKNRTKVKVIGIHNYSEVNRKLGEGNRKKGEGVKVYPGTKRIIAAAREHNRSTKFWYTETGGLVKLEGKDFPCNVGRAANRVKYMFTLAKRYKKFIRRLYTFNWSPTPDCNVARFDAGLINPDGTPRPGYPVFVSQLKNFKK